MFDAPWATEVTRLTVGITAVLLIMPLLAYPIARLAKRRGQLPAVVTTLIALVFGWGLSGFAYMDRIVAYQVRDGRLEIERPFETKSFSLAKLTAATPHAAWGDTAYRLHGSDGWYCYCGLFDDHKLGEHNAYVTDPRKVVVLRFADRRPLVVSPGDPAAFVRAVKPR